jgi:hypothetical protein
MKTANTQHSQYQPRETTTKQEWIHTASLLGIIGATLLTIGFLIEDVIMYLAPFDMPSLLGIAVGSLPAILLLSSLIALHAVLRDSYGWTGRAGAVILGLGFVGWSIGSFMFSTGIGDPFGIVWVFGSIGMLGMPLGAAVFGIGLWRSRVVSLAIAGLLILVLPGQLLHFATVGMIEAATGAGWGVVFFILPLAVSWIILCNELRTGTLDPVQ